jgi:ABC-type nitrate/sulfonate/bicarbonate transport system substrate-binding protein
MLFGKSKFIMLVEAAVLGLAWASVAQAAGTLKEIRIDWATYNPVSLMLKEKGLLERAFSKDGISIVWVQTLGSNKALEFLNAGSIDFGSTAGSAALLAKINGNPIKSIYVYSRPEWTALVTGKRQPNCRDCRFEGQARRRDAGHRSAHFSCARLADGRHEREGHHAGTAAAS